METSDDLSLVKQLLSSTYFQEKPLEEIFLTLRNMLIDTNILPPNDSQIKFEHVRSIFSFLKSCEKDQLMPEPLFSQISKKLNDFTFQNYNKNCSQPRQPPPTPSVAPLGGGKSTTSPGSAERPAKAKLAEIISKLEKKKRRRSRNSGEQQKQQQQREEEGETSGGEAEEEMKEKSTTNRMENVGDRRLSSESRKKSKIEKSENGNDANHEGGNSTAASTPGNRFGRKTATPAGQKATKQQSTPSSTTSPSPRAPSSSIRPKKAKSEKSPTPSVPITTTTTNQKSKIATKGNEKRTSVDESAPSSDGESNESENENEQQMDLRRRKNGALPRGFLAYLVLSILQSENRPMSADEIHESAISQMPNLENVVPKKFYQDFFHPKKFQSPPLDFGNLQVFKMNPDGKLEAVANPKIPKVGSILDILKKFGGLKTLPERIFDILVKMNRPMTRAEIFQEIQKQGGIGTFGSVGHDISENLGILFQKVDRNSYSFLPQKAKKENVKKEEEDGSGMSSSEENGEEEQCQSMKLEKRSSYSSSTPFTQQPTPKSTKSKAQKRKFSTLSEPEKSENESENENEKSNLLESATSGTVDKKAKMPRGFLPHLVLAILQKHKCPMSPSEISDEANKYPELITRFPIDSKKIKDFFQIYSVDNGKYKRSPFAEFFVKQDDGLFCYSDQAPVEGSVSKVIQTFLAKKSVRQFIIEILQDSGNLPMSSQEISHELKKRGQEASSISSDLSYGLRRHLSKIETEDGTRKYFLSKPEDENENTENDSEGESEKCEEERAKQTAPSTPSQKTPPQYTAKLILSTLQSENPQRPMTLPEVCQKINSHAPLLPFPVTLSQVQKTVFNALSGSAKYAECWFQRSGKGHYCACKEAPKFGSIPQIARSFSKSEESESSAENPENFSTEEKEDIYELPPSDKNSEEFLDYLISLFVKTPSFLYPKDLSYTLRRRGLEISPKELKTIFMTNELLFTPVERSAFSLSDRGRVRAGLPTEANPQTQGVVKFENEDPQASSAQTPSSKKTRRMAEKSKVEKHSGLMSIEKTKRPKSAQLPNGFVGQLCLSVLQSKNREMTFGEILDEINRFHKILPKEIQDTHVSGHFHYYFHKKIVLSGQEWFVLVGDRTVKSHPKAVVIGSIPDIVKKFYPEKFSGNAVIEQPDSQPEDTEMNNESESENESQFSEELGETQEENKNENGDQLDFDMNNTSGLLEDESTEDAQFEMNFDSEMWEDPMSPEEKDQKGENGVLDEMIAELEMDQQQQQNSATDGDTGPSTVSLFLTELTHSQQQV